MGELRIDAVRVTFDGSPALNGIDLVVPTGRTLAVLGPSGCGKSTLLRVVAGLQRPDRGRVSFDGADVTDTPTHKRGFALMFQDGQLFAHLDVAQNVGYALARRRVPKKQIRSRVGELLELVGLSDMPDRRPGSLSGGQQQRVALARALAAKPRLLLLDEPLSALDTALREQLAVQVRDVLHATGTTAVLVTHDQGEAFAIADDVAVLRAGQLIQHGAALDVWRHPADADAALFLGYQSVLPATAGELVGHPGRGTALRRGALTCDPDGTLGATVVSSAIGPDGLRLLVDADGLGRVHAGMSGVDLFGMAANGMAPNGVAGSSSGSAVPPVGARVRLLVDVQKVAELP